jgi:hypothetical protein
MPESRDGRILKPHLIKNRGKELPPTYTRTKTMLWNMVEDGLLEEPYRDHPQQAYLWSVKGTKAPGNYYNRLHDEGVGDLFVAYYNATQGEIYWDTRWPEDDKQDYNINRFGVNYDARMHYRDKVYFWEVERSTKDITGERSLETKIDKYIQFSSAFPQDRFTVLITFQGYRHIKAIDRLKETLAVLMDKKRGNQFLVGLHDKVLEQPLGEVFLSPVDPSKAVSLATF